MDDPCKEFEPIEYTKILENRDRTPMLNAQPISGESFDWIIDGKFTKTSDPHILPGSSSVNRLGRLGVYITGTKHMRLLSSGNL